jgi:hypothetical protein
MLCRVNNKVEISVHRGITFVMREVTDFRARKPIVVRPKTDAFGGTHLVPVKKKKPLVFKG